jgi:tetratricopeptide (TPR) repeat protein
MTRRRLCSGRSRLDPTLPRANNMMGLAALRKVASRRPRRIFARRSGCSLTLRRRTTTWAICWRPEGVREAAHHFEKAIAHDPEYVEARHSYGVVLALMQSYPRAVAELEAVIRLAPQLAQARLDLADALAAIGRVEEARAQFEAAAKSGDPWSARPRYPVCWI